MNTLTELAEKRTDSEIIISDFKPLERKVENKADQNVIKSGIRSDREANCAFYSGLTGFVLGAIGVSVVAPWLAEYWKNFANENVLSEYREIVRYATPIATQYALMLALFGIGFDLGRRRGKIADTKICNNILKNNANSENCNSDMASAACYETRRAAVLNGIQKHKYHA